MIEVKLKCLAHGQGLPLPSYQSVEAAGVDLMAALPAGEPVLLSGKAWKLVPTGFAIEMPQGYEAQIRPRSGLAYKYGVTVLNSPGTIDSDYRGEIKVLLINHGAEDFQITHGMRIAQMIISPVQQVTFVETKLMTQSERGTRGFGSTGV